MDLPEESRHYAEQLSAILDTSQPGGRSRGLQTLPPCPIRRT